MRQWITLVEATASAYYHVTLTKNLPSIQHQGLLPQRGPLSMLAGEGNPAIYLFRTLDAVEDGVANWMGDYLPDDEPLALLKVTLPMGVRTKRNANQFGYEFIVHQPIPPENLEVLSTDLDNYFNAFDDDE
jgi:hypothetical protein